MGWEAVGGALSLIGSIYSANVQSRASSSAAKKAQEAADRQTMAIRQNTIDTLNQNAQQFQQQQAALQAQYAEQNAYQQSLQVSAAVSQKVQEMQQEAAQKLAQDAAQQADVVVNNDQSTFIDQQGQRRPIRERYQNTSQSTGSGLSI